VLSCRITPDIGVTAAAMDAAGVDFGLLSACSATHRDGLISNDDVADWVAAHPHRFAGLAAVDLNPPMQAVRELRRRVVDRAFGSPYLWEASPTDRRYYPLFAACVDLSVPFFTQAGHTQACCCRPRSSPTHPVHRPGGG
jgi:predicted TIM-barrel fold metal-dependent hydrolase